MSVIIGDPLLARDKQGRYAAFEKPSRRVGPGSPVSQVDIDKRAVEYGLFAPILQVRKTLQYPDANVAQIFDHLFEVHDDKRIILKTENVKRGTGGRYFRRHVHSNVVAGHELRVTRDRRPFASQIKPFGSNVMTGA